ANTLVHAPLAHWAHARADVVAIDDGQNRLTFAQLHTAVVQHADTLIQQHAPATVFVDDQLSIIQQMVSFMGITHSGRCAAVSDPDWPSALRSSVKLELGTALTEPCHTQSATPTSPFYIGFTSGSTGVPKGFRRHHQSWTESLRVCLDTFGPDATRCVMAPGRFSHSLFLFGMVMGLWTGAGVVVQERFSAPRLMDTLRTGRTPCLVAVPSQLLLMLELAARRQPTPIEGVRLILISGARWMRDRTKALQALFPNARIVEFYGASETSFMAWMDADASAPPNAVGKPFSNVDIDIRQPEPPLGTGQIFVRSPMLFTDYVGAANDHTAAVRDGEWLSVRDMGYIDAQGYLCLVGRENRMVVTQGKNLFPEEVESVLLSSPAVAQASVLGVPDAIRGQLVVAIVCASNADADVSAHTLADLCRSKLESYKVPKRFFVCTDWPMTASGKTDHPALAQQFQNYLTDEKATSCIRPLL
ncbi:MAG: AMP-binding protein, partial [Limnohabitans sp.]|nr:AMP-binding protein [Limnohabitans sp.]